MASFFRQKKSTQIGAIQFNRKDQNLNCNPPTYSWSLNLEKDKDKNNTETITSLFR
jgi:hypothetical protein